MSTHTISLSQKNKLRTNILLVLLCSLLFICNNYGQTSYFPPLTGDTWQTTSPSSLGWDQTKETALFDFLENKNSKAFILLVDGKIVYEKYFGTFTQDSLWYWASAGKTLTSFMVGVAKSEGKLALSDKTSKYLGKNWTSLPADKEDLITIRHQLTMTTGLDDGVNDPYCTLPSCLVYAKDAGSRWSYHNGPYTLLDNVIEQATGTTLNQYITNKVKIKTGITGSFLKVDYNNVFFSKPRSMARFGLLMLNKGKWQNEVLIADPTYLEEAMAPSQTLNPSYGYLWWLNGQSTFMVPGLQLMFPGPLMTFAPDDTKMALGKNGQFINVVPSKNMVWIRMGNAPDGNDVPFLLNNDIWSYLQDIIVTSTNETTTTNTIRLLPNPADEEVIIECPLALGSLQIITPDGKVAYQNGTVHFPFSLHTGAWKNGLYSVKITNNTGNVFTSKLAIQSE